MLQVQLIPIEELKISPLNPREISKSRLEALKTSIENDPEFLHNRPILATVIEDQKIIYAGAQRYTACKELGYEEVPVIVEEDLTQEQIDKRMLLDNTHRGVFDNEFVFDFARELSATLGLDLSFAHEMVTGLPDEVKMETEETGKKQFKLKIGLFHTGSLENWEKLEKHLELEYLEEKEVSTQLLLFMQQNT